MSDPASSAPGALIRAAREQQGMAIETLAAVLKVPQSKLEALEAGRFDSLPDATFTRALAQSVCRLLKLDPTPVLAALPDGGRAIGLEKVTEGLNTPYRDRPGSVVPGDFTPWRSPVWWAVGTMLVAAGVFVLVPPHAVTRPARALAASDASVSAPIPAPTDAQADAQADAPSKSPTAVSGLVTQPGRPASGPVTLAAAPASVDPALAAAQGAAIMALQATWIQATDGAGQSLMSRLVPAGETLELVGTPPIRLKIGNARGTQLLYRGRPVDLTPFSRDNIATLDLP